LAARLQWLGRFAKPRLSDLFAADVGLFLQDMIDGANVDDVGRRNLVLILAAKVAHPDINSLLEGKLRNAQTDLLWIRRAIEDDVRKRPLTRRFSVVQ
jgi:hypothetical protein